VVIVAFVCLAALAWALAEAADVAPKDSLVLTAKGEPGVRALDAKLLDAAGRPTAVGGTTESKLDVVSAGQKPVPRTIERKLTELREILGIPLRDLRWKQGDTPGAEQPGFDDSSWALASPEMSWRPEGSIAWFRKKVTIPDTIAGLPVSGSPIIPLVGVDDDGEVYVNGILRQKFHRDQGRVVLTDSAPPGADFLIAVKGMNGPGAGRLLSAKLRVESLEDLQRDVGAYLDDLGFARATLQYLVEGGEGRRDAIATSVSAVNLDAIGAGNKQAFLDSLRAAREPLRPVAAELKNFAVHLVGHAHIDMNWLWLWPETVEVCRSTFRGALDFMREFPEFTFSQSQASTYVAVEQNYPDIFAEIGQRVKEGRWEVTGGTWVEGDMNMASGEAIARQILYAKRYFRDKFGVDVRIAWEPDTFGHAWTIPQILKKAGIDYYYFCRCGKGIPMFWWEAPDGSRVLAYNVDGYGGGINDSIGNLPLEFSRTYGVADSMQVYGVGDHGGGPTRTDVESALELQRRLVFPRVKFSTAQAFFDRALSQTTKFPVVRDELNFTFEGCYTTHADIKRWNRTSENLLPAAEAFSALAAAYGRAYPRDGFTTAWRNTCFNQFHDIFDGSAIHGAYDYSRGLFDETHKLGSHALNGALRVLASRVDTRGKGASLVVFNPMAWDRTDTVTAAVDLPAGLAGVRVTDDRGKEVPAQIVGREAESGELRVTFTAHAPSLGYRVFHVEAAEKGKAYRGGAAADDSGRLENEFWRLQVDTSTGLVISIYDKRKGLQLIPPGERANVFQALFEKPHGMSAWSIGQIRGTENLDGPAEVRVFQRGPACAAIRVTRKWRASTFTQHITLYAGVERIDFVTAADWHEIGTPQADFPMIKVAFPAALTRAEATFEIPFGSIVRPADGHEVPAQKWIDLSGTAPGNLTYGLSLLNDSKYGHDVNGTVMRLTLLRCPYSPDPRPDEGEHHFTYSLYPHARGWRQAKTVRRSYELNNPLIPVVQRAHPGRLPTSYSFLCVEPDSLIVTALKCAEDSQDVILRFYESEGADVRARVAPGFNWSGATEVTLMEAPTGTVVHADASQVRLQVKPWEIKTLRLGGRGRGKRG